MAYWLAHVYAEVVASHRTQLGEDAGLLVSLREAMIEELPIFLPTVVLLACVVGLELVGFSKADAIYAMLAVGCAVLAAWGYIAARHHGNSHGRSVVVGLIGVFIGLLIVAAKASLH
jgi:hypothetical protein